MRWAGVAFIVVGIVLVAQARPAVRPVASPSSGGASAGPPGAAHESRRARRRGGDPAAAAHRDDAEAAPALVDRPILDHVLDHLVAHGVREKVIMSSPYLEETFDPFIRSRGEVPTITWVTGHDPGHRRRDRQRPPPARRRTVPRPERRHRHRPRSRCRARRPRRAIRDRDDRAAHGGRRAHSGLVETERDGRVGVPGEAERPDPRRHQRRHVPPGAGRAPRGTGGRRSRSRRRSSRR